MTHTIARPAPPPILAQLHRHEAWLVLLAAPPLVLAELFPQWAQVAALGWIALLWVVRWAVTGKLTSSTALDPPIVALLLTVPLAVEAASRLGGAATDGALSRAASLVFSMALFYALANALNTPERVWSAVRWLLVAGLGVAAVGMVSVSWLDKVPGLTPFFPRLIPSIPHATLNTSVHPNQLASVLLVFVFLAAACLRAPRVGDAPLPDPLAAPRGLRSLAALVLVVSIALLLLTQSRGAWLAALLVTVAWLLGRRHVLGAWLIVGSLIAMMAVVAYGPARLAALGQLSPATSPSAASTQPTSAGQLPVPGRLRVWSESIEMLAVSPATGIGLNAFPLVHGRRPEYEGGFIYQGLAHAHNTLLQAALDFGLPGLVAVVGLYVALAWSTWRAHSRLVGTALDVALAGLALGLSAQAVHGLVDALAIGAKPGFLVWAAAGILVALRRHGYNWAKGRP
jgi:O-antigen ligase